jgi:hypothetical protein
MSKQELTEAVKQAIAAAVVNGALVNVNHQAPVQTVDGKIVLPTKAKAEKQGRPDPRIPATIITIAQNKDTTPITLGYSTTTKDERGRDVNYGFGISMLDENGKPTMIFHTARKWALLAQVAPLVSAAILERYQ